MKPTTIDAVLERLRNRAERDEAFADALACLAAGATTTIRSRSRRARR